MLFPRQNGDYNFIKSSPPSYRRRDTTPNRLVQTFAGGPAAGCGQLWFVVEWIAYKAVRIWCGRCKRAMPRTPSEALGQGGLSDSDRAWHVREGVAVVHCPAARRPACAASGPARRVPGPTGFHQGGRVVKIQSGAKQRGDLAIVSPCISPPIL